MNKLKLIILTGFLLISGTSSASLCDDNPDDLMCVSGLGGLAGDLFKSPEKTSDDRNSNNKETSDFCDDNPDDLICTLGGGLPTGSLSLEGFEGGLSNIGSNIEDGINNVVSGVSDFGEGFFEGALETVSEFLGNGEIYGLTKKLLGHIVKSNYHYVKALNIQIDAETEKDFAECIGDKFCSSSSMDRIISLSPQIMREIERINRDSEKLSTKALEEFEKGNIETSLAWSEGGIVLAQFALAAQAASVSCTAAANSDEQIIQIIGGIACIGSIAVIADITGSVNKFYTSIKIRGESKDLYEFSKANGLQPPQKSGPS
jgi:hypothetical protein